MSAWEREHGELPDPNLLLFSRKTGQELFVFRPAPLNLNLNLNPNPNPNLNLNPNLLQIKIKIRIKIRNQKAGPGKTQIGFDSGLVPREI
jgi:hypothetical protein